MVFHGISTYFLLETPWVFWVFKAHPKLPPRSKRRIPWIDSSVGDCSHHWILRCAGRGKRVFRVLGCWVDVWSAWSLFFLFCFAFKSRVFWLMKLWDVNVLGVSWCFYLLFLKLWSFSREPGGFRRFLAGSKAAFTAFTTAAQEEFVCVQKQLLDGLEKPSTKWARWSIFYFLFFKSRWDS